MRLVLPVFTAMALFGACAREGLRPVLSYPRDIVAPEADDALDQTTYEEASSDNP